MKIISALIVSLAVAAVMSLAGCTSKPVSQDSAQIIEESKARGDANSQAQFLVDQANALIASKSYTEAVDVANYVIANFKDKAPQAQKILENAQAKLQADLKEKMGTMQKDLNATTNDLNKKINSGGK